MLSLSDAEERSLPGPESDGTRRIMEISSNTNKKVDDNSVTDPLPAPADDDLNSENSNPPHELLPAKTRSRTEPFDVYGVLSRAITAHDTDPDFALALQKCREENSILSIAFNVHNIWIDHSANQVKHIPIYGVCTRITFFNAAFLHHNSFADVASLCDRLWLCKAEGR